MYLPDVTLPQNPKFGNSLPIPEAKHEHIGLFFRNLPWTWVRVEASVSVARMRRMSEAEMGTEEQTRRDS
jgi:hypothetical protein